MENEKFKEFKEIILKAGEIFKEGFYSSKEITLKGKKDLVTEYDVKIEEFLKKEFKKFDYSIIAEESVKDKFDNSIIIDPIDGTTNFAHQIPHCAISVGVYENKMPKFAFVYNPILNEFYTAISGEGAYKNDKRIEISKNDYFQRALIATGFPYSSADNTDDLDLVINRLHKILPKCQDIRRLGSAALDLCYVAEGKYEGFYEINLKPWDVSAGMLIVKEAGGEISNDRGEEFDMFNDKCIVASNGLIHNKLIELLNSDK
ncbi:inositol monophosphatase family protein [Nautilia lithotrophica]